LTPEQVVTAASHLDKPSLLRTGSIDGESSLGWNLPESDFFAVSAEETKEALTTLAQHASRIWHYRLYDTVSDPQGVIRQWLAGNTAQTFAQSIPGRDFLQVEAYNSAIPPVLPRGDVALAQVLDAQLRLAEAAAPPSSPAGEIIYVKAIWQAGTATDPTQVALSLRLLDSRGYLVSQQDTALQLGDTPISVQWLALPIPADTMPGIYTLGLVMYSPITLAPFPISLPDGLIQESPLPLGDLSVTLPQEVPRSGHALASFDYIDLIQSSISATPLAPGAAFPLELTWRPRASAYRDHYRARLSLADTQGHQVTLSEFDLGADEYPSSRWPAGFPLRQRDIIQVPATLEDGDYVLQLAVVRATDGQRISARLPWRLVQEETVELGVLRVQAAQ
jgi:hypothetical protein